MPTCKPIQVITSIFSPNLKVLVLNYSEIIQKWNIHKKEGKLVSHSACRLSMLIWSVRLFSLSIIWYYSPFSFQAIEDSGKYDEFHQTHDGNMFPSNDSYQTIYCSSIGVTNDQGLRYSGSYALLRGMFQSWIAWIEIHHVFIKTVLGRYKTSI